MIFITAAQNTNIMPQSSDHGPKYDNGADDSISEPLTHSGPLYARVSFHYTGAVKTAMDLRNFPFDSQVRRDRLRLARLSFTAFAPVHRSPVPSQLLFADLCP